MSAEKFYNFVVEQKDAEDETLLPISQRTIVAFCQTKETVPARKSTGCKCYKADQWQYLLNETHTRVSQDDVKDMNQLEQSNQAKELLREEVTTKLTLNNYTTIRDFYISYI